MLVRQGIERPGSPRTVAAPVESAMDRNSGVSADTKNANVSIAYTHVVKIYDDAIAARVRLTENANKLALIIAIIFAALSFGAGHLMLIARNPQRNDGLYWFSVVVALIAAIALSAAFLAAMNRSRLRIVSTPRVSGLIDRIKDADFLNADHARIVAALATSVERAIKTNFDAHNKQLVWARILNWAPQVGFLSTALFVACTFAQSMALPLITENDPAHEASMTLSTQEENEMRPEDDDNGNGGENDNGGAKDATDAVVEDIIGEPEIIRGDDTHGGAENTRLEKGKS